MESSHEQMTYETNTNTMSNNNKEGKYKHMIYIVYPLLRYYQYFIFSICVSDIYHLLMRTSHDGRETLWSNHRSVYLE